MRTYVVEIGGDPVAAFRAEDMLAAEAFLGDPTFLADLQVLESDGRPLWDGRRPITTSLAPQSVHEEWQKARDADPDNVGDDPDDYIVYLVPVTDPIYVSGVIRNTAN